jgi:hypothetical protein
MGVAESHRFTFAEREEFQRAFGRISEKLPRMFHPFWHRWEELSESLPTAMVYAEDGSQVLRLTRLVSGKYRAEGFTREGTVMYAFGARSISEALREAGII